MKKTKSGIPSNVHVVDFKKKSKAEASDSFSFDAVIKKLESRVNGLESDLKGGLEVLEKDVAKLVEISKKNHLSDALKEDIEALLKTLEIYVTTALNGLIELSKSKLNKNELKFLKELARDVVKLLSFDFYKNIFKHFNMSDENSEVDEFGMDKNFLASIKPFFDFLYYKYWRVTATGLENIPDDGRALIVANHSGTLPYDGSMLATSILNEHSARRDVRFLVEDFVYHFPTLGTFMYRIGGVRACFENAERLLNKDHLLIVFPEGVKGIGKYHSEKYQLQRFGRGGFIKLCVKTKSPLIPVGIVGAEEIHPIIFKSNILAKTLGIPYIPITPTFPLLGILGLLPFPTKWSLHFGKPLHLEKCSEKILDDEIRVHQLSEKVRDEIQKILNRLLKKRKSVWY